MFQLTPRKADFISDGLNELLKAKREALKACNADLKKRGLKQQFKPADFGIPEIEDLKREIDEHADTPVRIVG